MDKNVWGKSSDWAWVPTWLVVGAAIPALIYWLIFHTLHVEGDDQSTVASLLAFAGTGATIWIRNR